MVKTSTFKLTGVMAGVAALCLSIVPSMSASAAASPQGVCGSGYYVQRSHQLPGATVYQMYNGTTNCVVTIKNNTAKATRTTAGLQVEGQNWSYDTGDYKSYAGPVKQYGKGKCVRYFGFHAGTSFTSPWGNCK